MRLNKKGFTLVELLAVIVILAVVMLIAVTSVGPMMAKSRKSALATEGIALTDAAETAYQTEQMKGNSSVIKATSTVCFDLAYLTKAGLFEKTSDDGYKGSVLVTYNTDGTYDYTFWISNGTYQWGSTATAVSTTGINPNGYDVENATQVTDGTGSLATFNSCGKTVTSDKISGVVYCDSTGTCNAAA